jgi:tRNA-splicing ligase RtcB
MALRNIDRLEARARELCQEAGIDPDSRVPKLRSARGQPAWCEFRELARAERNAEAAREAAANFVNLRPQESQYQNTPLQIFGEHDEGTLAQARNCLNVGNVVAASMSGDGHLGYYSHCVGLSVAYDKQISITGVGVDIGCGNNAVKTDARYESIKDRIGPILNDIVSNISFGVGRKSKKRVEHELFDDLNAWRAAEMEAYRQKAMSQLGTVGGGNHYVDLFVDESGFVWIGSHFGSRGTGHTVASDYIKKAGGSEGVHTIPALVDVDSDLGRGYIAAMQLAGRIASAGRVYVTHTIATDILGATVTDEVINHHNYAWEEKHVIDGVERDVWVVRKGATPSRPGQRSFVGGSMGDDAVILEGLDTEEARRSLYSTVHGAGRLFGRKVALKTFTRAQMDDWLREKGVMVSGGDLDESPMAYRRLPDVLKHHAGSVKVLHTLRPIAVAMAGRGDFDPWKES